MVCGVRVVVLLMCVWIRGGVTLIVSLAAPFSFACAL